MKQRTKEKIATSRSVCRRFSNKIPSKVGHLGNPLEELDSCPGKRTGTCRAKKWVGIFSNERIVICLGNVAWDRGLWVVFL